MALRLRLRQPRWTIRVNRGTPGRSDALLEVLGWSESALDSALRAGVDGRFEGMPLGESAAALLNLQAYAVEALPAGEVSSTAMALRSAGVESIPSVEARADRLDGVFSGAEPVGLAEVGRDVFLTLGIEVELESLSVTETATSRGAAAQATAEAIGVGEAPSSRVAFAAAGSAEALGVAEAVAARMQQGDLLAEPRMLVESALDDMSHLDGGPLVEVVTDYLSPAGSMQHWTEDLAETLALQGAPPTTDVTSEGATIAENHLDVMAVAVARAEALALNESRTDSIGARNAWTESLSEFIPLATTTGWVEAVVELIPLGS